MADYLTGRGGVTGIPLPFSDSGIYGNFTAYIFNGLDPPSGNPAGAGVVEIRFPWYDAGADYGYVTYQTGVQFPYVAFGPPPIIGAAPATYRYHSQAVLKAGPSAGTVTADAYATGATLAILAGDQSSITFTGTLSFSVDGIETFSIDLLSPTEAVYAPDPMDPASIPFPVTGGNAMFDGLMARKAALSLAPRDGQTVTVSVSINGATASASFTWSSGLGWYHGLTYLLSATGRYGFTGQASGVPMVQTVPLFDQAAYTFSNTDSTWRADGSGVDVTNAAGATNNSAYLVAAAEIPTSYKLVGSFVGADGTARASALTVSYPGGSLAITGDGNTIIDQKSYDVQALYGVFTGPTLIDEDSVSDEKVWMTAAITQDSLKASHLDRRTWRCLFRLYSVDAFTLAQDESYTILPSDFEGWDASSGGIGHTSSTGSATATITPGGSPDRTLWGAYRYAEFDLKAPTGTVFTITLANQDISKEYHVTTTGTVAAYLRIDTASPKNAPSGVGDTWDRDNRYPLRPQPNGGDGPTNSEPDDDTSYLDVVVDPSGDPTDPDTLTRQQTWFWGATDVTSVGISAAFPVGTATEDQVFEVGGIRLVQSVAPKMTFSDGFTGQSKVTQDGIDCIQMWPITASGGRTTQVGGVWGGPYALWNIDGRVVYDIPGCGFRTFVAGGFEWAYDSAAQLASNLGWYPGTTATTSGSSIAWLSYDVSTAYALEAGGCGTTFDALTPKHWIDVDLGAVPAQLCVDWFRGWPGGADGNGGEFVDDDTVGGPWALRTGAHMGTRSQGFVFQNDGSSVPGDPAPGLSVWNERTDTADDLSTTKVRFGLGVSDTDASYSSDVTSGPVGRPAEPYTYDGFEGGDESDTTTLQQSPFPFEQSRFRARWIKRTAFRGTFPTADKNPHLAESPLGRLSLAYGKADGSIWARSAVNGYPDWLHNSKISDVGFRPRLAYMADGGDLLVGYEVSGSCKLRTSRDHGKTWSDEIDMGYGYRPEPAASHTGGLIYLRLENVGGSPPEFQIYVRHRTKDPGLVWSSETLVVDDMGNPISCELEGWGGVVAPWSLSGGWLMALTPYGETSVATYLSKQRTGLTFKRT